MDKQPKETSQAPRQVLRRKVLGAAVTGGVAVGMGLTAVRKATAQSTITFKMQSTWPTKDIFHEVFVDWGRK